MSDFDLGAEQIATARRVESLARKVNLLLDVIMQENGKPYDFPAVRAAAKKHGYELSRTRWSLLLNAKPQTMPDEALVALAAVFDVNPDYLRLEDGEVPEQVEAELALLVSLRKAQVRNFAARALGPVKPELMRAIAKLIDEDDDE